MVGEVFGSYRIVRKIGEGGMGAVYLAEHTLIGRQAAIKVLLRGMSHRQELVTRFFNEARAATAVKHPGIVEIYDFGYHTDGSAYIVMEYLDGESLAERLRVSGTLPELRAAALTRQVAGALAAAHAKGIVHRDLKPDNIFIVRDQDIVDGERTKILDFGIAKLAPTEHGASVTRTGMVMGTPAYMSPEQSKGAGQVDSRTDVYALGCILFEMVCGRPPFVGEGAGGVMAQHIYAAVPPPSSFRPVSPALEQVILRALAKAAEERFQSADDMIAALHSAVPSGMYPRASATEPTVAVQPSSAPYPAATPQKTTTLSAAAGTTTPPVARKKTGFVVAAVGVVAIAGIAIAVIGMRNGGERQAAKAPDPAAPPGPPTGAPTAPPPQPVTAEPAPVPPTPTAPKRVTIKIDTQPHGADVYRMPQGVRIGTTPLEYPMDSLDGQVVLIVKKKGYNEQELAVAANRDSEQSVTLARSSVAHPHPSKLPEPSTPTATEPDSGSLDPFDKLNKKKSVAH